jgi:hypothetical protein
MLKRLLKKWAAVRREEGLQEDDRQKFIKDLSKRFYKNKYIFIKSTRSGARTPGHQIKSLALYQLS